MYIYKILTLNDNLITNKSIILYINLTDLINFIQMEIKTTLIYLYPSNIKFYNQSLIFNIFLHYSKGFICFIFILSLILSYYHFKIIKISLDKLFLLLLPILLSNLLLISTSDLIIAYLAIELQNLCLIFIIALKKKDSFNVQLSIRFFILNSIGSLFILLGIVLIYSIFLTTNIVNIYMIMSTLPLNIINSLNLEFLFALFLLLIGIFFKLTVGPFGLWLVEIYEYGLTSSVIIYSLLPKIGYFIFLFHLYLSTSYYLIYWDFILKFFGIISILIGTFGALSQVYLKRLLAFSSLNYFGYILLSFIGFNQKSFIICILYFFVYIFISFYIWYIIIYLEKILKRNIILTDLAILREKSEFLSYILSLSLFFLAGLPPFYLFVLKFMTFAIFLYSNTNIFIIVFFLICSFISIFYYLQLIKIIHFNPIDDIQDDIEHSDMYIHSIIYYLIGFYFICIISPLFFLLSQNLIYNLDLFLNSYLKDFISINFYSHILYYVKRIFNYNEFGQQLVRKVYFNKFKFKMFRFEWKLPNSIYYKKPLNIYTQFSISFIDFYKFVRKSPVDLETNIISNKRAKQLYNLLGQVLVKFKYVAVRSRKALFIDDFDKVRAKRWVDEYESIKKPVYRLCRDIFLKSIHVTSGLMKKRLSPHAHINIFPIDKRSPFYKINFARHFILASKRDTVLIHRKGIRLQNFNKYFIKYIKYMSTLFVNNIKLSKYFKKK